MYNPKTVYISTFSGAGGNDAKDWSNMLLKMYSKYAEKKGWKVYIVDENTIEIKGKKDIYSFLKNESGVHRLVRISPFNSKRTRHTSFALVEVLPELEHFEASQIKIPEDDLKVSFYKSSGPGGQNVNKVESAVRITHLPTGVTSSSQAERSQARNREKALKLLKSKLAKLMEEKAEDDLSNLRIKSEPDWGHEIRSYVLHPYKLVRDKRLNVKINKVEDVLEGDLDLLYKKVENK